MRNNRGFTLVELMIAVLIIGIISAIAYPSYQEHVEKSRRADGQGLLLDIAARQERFYFDTGSFAAVLTDLRYSADTIDSPEGYYSISIDNGATPEAYTVTAIRQGVQANDGCGDLTIDQIGQKSMINADAGKLPTDCW